MSGNKDEIAESLVREWAPFCERIEVAGSIRRGKPDPKDIEIVAVPKFIGEMQEDLFGDMMPSERVDTLNRHLKVLKAGGGLRDRLDKNGRPAWGERFKRVLVEGVAVDVFSVLPPAQWGVIFAIRTGPADFGHALVTSRILGGFMPPGMNVKDGQLWSAGAVVSTPEEDEFFRAIGVPCWSPRDRTPQRLSKWRQAAGA